jgi:hypothetical protein
LFFQTNALSNLGVLSAGIDCTDGFVIIKSGGIEAGEVSHHSSKQPCFKHFKTGKLVPTKALSAMT